MESNPLEIDRVNLRRAAIAFQQSAKALLAADVAQLEGFSVGAIGHSAWACNNPLEATEWVTIINFPVPVHREARRTKERIFTVENDVNDVVIQSEDE